MGMIDPALQIEDYTDIEDGVNAIYGELIDESLLAADETAPRYRFIFRIRCCCTTVRCSSARD